MKRLIHCTCLLVIALAFGASLAQAQTQNAQTKNANHVRTTGEFKLTDLLAQARPPQRAGFSLMPASRVAQQPQAPIINLVVLGGGTVGRVAKWTGSTLINSFIGDSNIFEDSSGRVGIGTPTPASLLTVAGMIQTTLGGIKFPDGTVQTTAAIFSVAHDASLTEQGTTASLLGVAPGGVQTVHLANNSVTAAKIAPGQVVKSLNALRDDVLLAAGSNVTITPTGNTLTIAATSSGIAQVVHDNSLRGDGVGSTAPLGVNIPLELSDLVDGGAIITGGNNGTTNAIGVRGNSPNGTGVQGNGEIGVVGVSTTSTGIGIVGNQGPGDSAGTFFGGVLITTDLLVIEDKSFVEPHPTDPNKMIRYICLEGPEAGTYFRGSGRVTGGVATIEVPEDFRMVTDEKGITVQVTPMGESATIWCVRKSLDKIELRASADVEFDFLVNGVRKTSKDHKAIVENTVFIPRSPDDDWLKQLNPEAVRRLKATGILNADGSVNMETVQKLDAYKRKSKQQ